MQKIATLAAAAIAAALLSVPASAQVSTGKTSKITHYTCTAKNARNKSFTFTHTKLDTAKSQVLKICRYDAFPKGCRITGCVG